MDTTLTTADFVLGTAQLAAVEPKDAAQIIRAALNAGVEWLDTTSSDDDNERRVAAALPGTRGVRIATTVTPIASEDTGAVRRALIESIRLSCSRLRRDRLDVLLLSSAQHLTSHAGVIWQTVKRLRDEGMIYDLGVCASSPEEALAAIADPNVRHLQIEFTLFDRRWPTSGIVEALQKRTEITIHARAAETPHRIDPATVARLVADLDRDSRIDLCLAYMRGQSWIDGIVIDADSLTEFALSRALFKRPALTAEEIGIVDRAIAAAPRLFRVA